MPGWQTTASVWRARNPCGGAGGPGIGSQVFVVLALELADKVIDEATVKILAT